MTRGDRLGKSIRDYIVEFYEHEGAEPNGGEVNYALMTLIASRIVFDFDAGERPEMLRNVYKHLKAYVAKISKTADGNAD